MRIEQLEYVAAVNRLGSLRRASEQLHISQPALSEAVSRLEKELGVTLLDRRRSGARISRQGRDLLPHLLEAIEAVGRLRAAAGDQRASTQPVRLGTVNTATTQVLVPALKAMQRSHPEVSVEVLDMLQADIIVGLEEGTLDLALINVLSGDDVPVSVQATALVTGSPVVVVPSGHRYAAQPAVSVDDLRAEPFVMMRPGYVMHRLAHRLFRLEVPASWRTADGAEMGKLMVAEDLGLTLLPDFSVVGDPLHRSGAIATRPVAGETGTVTLTLLTRRDPRLPAQVRGLATALVEQARAWNRRAGRTAADQSSG
ncbi:LysR family transcriptional regulator [Nocardioides sp. KC13]|uniref:LysR family transcriptional regulator n=1 Tax=Nocardioides turkmenicus TaxID=2711220 RepID=A0A6M1R393_9ACTN|nr:LysR family transcriptional regulator [Nocardioides sp. KC13]NGN94714.1 LysR family transcriptional regulator [Nocardioides sp. KC13]